MKITIPKPNKSGGITKLVDVDNHIRKFITPIVGQINHTLDGLPETAQVVEVFTSVNEVPLDENEEPIHERIGAIRYRKIGTEQNIPDEECPIAYPVNPHFTSYPLLNEQVRVYDIFGTTYYETIVNEFFGFPNNVAVPGKGNSFSVVNSKKGSADTLSVVDTGIIKQKQATAQPTILGDYFTSNKRIRRISQDEGDIVINGRFGQSIQIGSNVKNEAPISPNIKLRVGQLSDADKFELEELKTEVEASSLHTAVDSNINADGSSIYMTTDETVDLQPVTKDDDSDVYNQEFVDLFNGKQIVMNSGKLIFNSKDSGIYSFAQGNIEMSTLQNFGVKAKQEMFLYAPTMNIGNRDNIPINGSQQTKNINLYGSTTNVDMSSKLNVIAPRINLGVNETEPAVKGDILEELLNELIDSLVDLASVVNVIATTPVAVPSLGTPTPQAYAPEAKKALNLLPKLTNISIQLNNIKSRVVTVE